MNTYEDFKRIVKDWETKTSNDEIIQSRISEIESLFKSGMLEEASKQTARMSAYIWVEYIGVFK